MGRARRRATRAASLSLRNDAPHGGRRRAGWRHAREVEMSHVRFARNGLEPSMLSSMQQEEGVVERDAPRLMVLGGAVLDASEIAAPLESRGYQVVRANPDDALQV